MSAERKITYAQALREAIKEEMDRDLSVVLMGQDVKKSVWGVTTGLENEVENPERIIPLPISENGFVGAAVGAALTGMRPVVEFMFGDFLLLAMDSLANEAAKYRYMAGGGDFKVPLVLRLAGCGIGSGNAAHHSQYPEAWALNFPGLKIVAPATPSDAKALLKSAIRDENPVLFIEYKLLYAKTGSVNEEEVPIGKARVAREGTDLTVVTYANGVYKTMAAADKLAAEGIDAEIIDLRTIRPMDKETILESVKKTSRLVIVEDSIKTGSVGAEISSIVAEEAIGYLDSPIIRVAGADTSIPAGRDAEKYVIPNEEDILKAIKGLF